jgi:hypothetical protein
MLSYADGVTAADAGLLVMPRLLVAPAVTVRGSNGRPNPAKYRRARAGLGADTIATTWDRMEQYGALASPFTAIHTRHCQAQQ